MGIDGANDRALRA